MKSRGQRGIDEGRSRLPLNAAVNELLEEQQLSISELARRLGVSQPFLSRAIRGVGGKRASAELLEAIADELHVGPEYFLEYRRLQINDWIAADPRLADQVYRYIEGRRER